MSDDIEILNNIFNNNSIGQMVLRTTCPFCNSKATFRQLSEVFSSRTKGSMISILCEGCCSVITFSVNERKLYPSPMLGGVEGLPEEIDKYYQEALRCISADSPSGAVTLFRKTIHAIGIHYNIAQKNDTKNLFSIITQLEADGHITPKIRDALLGIKDIGNDGAHINENEPDMSQALILKALLDMTLNSTILSDQNLKMIKIKHQSNKAISVNAKRN